MAFIRPYKESDFDACAQICRATLPPSLSSNPIAVKLSPYLWTHQYTYLSPSTCHILEDGAGNAVGYCIGCPDVFAFAASYGRYVNEVLSRDVARPDNLETREPWMILDDSTAGGRMVVNPVAMAQTACQYSFPLCPCDCTPATQPRKLNTAVLTRPTNPDNPNWLLLEGQDHLTGRWRATMHIDMLEPYQGKGWGRKLIEQFVASVQASGADYGEGEHIGIARENDKVIKFYERVGFRLIVPDGTKSSDEGSINMVRDIEKPKTV